ncbi:MAG: hypothetical protein HWE25_15670 [Alphaproteobacteria bacterium]|nr:hypothetical protein [Alphaproteobacteria bacterium]
MKFATLSLIVSLVSISSHAMEPKLPPSEMLADFAELKSALEAVHPDIYRHRSEAETQAIADAIENALASTSMDKWTFYRVIAPYAAGIMDGHTFVRPPARFSEISKGQSVHLPLRIKVQGHKLFVAENLTSHDALDAGVEILSINGHAAEVIVENFRSQYADIVPKDDVYSRAFMPFLAAGFGMAESYDVQLASGITVPISGLTAEELEKARSGTQRKEAENQTPNFRLYFPEKLADVAVIEVNLMRDAQAFNAFASDAFSQIRQRGINLLVIDFRNNEGGDSAIGDTLAHYLTSKPMREWQSLIKVSDQFKDHFADDIGDDPALQQALSAPNGSLVSEPDTTANKKRPSPGQLFDGEVRLLTSGYTYSSASMFAGIFKCDNLGVIVGQPTGQATNFFGELTQMTLSNSGLNFLVSMKEFRAPCEVSMTEGVQPDILLPNDVDALQTVLKGK